MRETSAPLRLAVVVTVPIACSVSSDCNVLVRIAQDNSEMYLSLCSLSFRNGTTTQAFEIAVKRDFLYGTDKQSIIRLEVENLNDPVYFVRHHKIPEIVVSISQYIVTLFQRFIHR